MHPEAAFLTGYALVLVAVAAGLDALGRRSAHPWTSKVLAASRPPGAQLDGEPDWPHAEVPGFHLGLSSVALTAALLLTVASVARHHRPLELVVQLTVLALIAARIARIITRHRALAPGPRDWPSQPGGDRRGSPMRSHGR